MQGQRETSRERQREADRERERQRERGKLRPAETSSNQHCPTETSRVNQRQTGTGSDRQGHA